MNKLQLRCFAKRKKEESTAKQEQQNKERTNHGFWRKKRRFFVSLTKTKDGGNKQSGKGCQFLSKKQNETNVKKVVRRAKDDLKIITQTIMRHFISNCFLQKYPVVIKATGCSNAQETHSTLINKKNLNEKPISKRC